MMDDFRVQVGHQKDQAVVRSLELSFPFLSPRRGRACILTKGSVMVPLCVCGIYVVSLCVWLCAMCVVSV